MKVVILTLGTRGDVQPFLALSLGLQQAGHDVILGADSEFKTMIEAYNVPYKALHLGLKDFMNSPQGQLAMAEEKAIIESFETTLVPMLDACWEIAQQAELLIYDTMLFPAYYMAQKLKIPAIMASVMPNMSPTKAFPLIGAPHIGLGAWGNRLSYYLYYFSWWQGHTDVKRWAKKTLKLVIPGRYNHYGQRNDKPVPALYAYSSALSARPSDWSESVCVSGYWFLENQKRPILPKGLQAFIENDKQPLSIGFGSMVGMDSEQLTDIVLAAVQQTGQRAVILTGWGGLIKKASTDSIFYVESLDYAWLFPKMCAVVHHGGAGTTAAGLRAAKPTLICPFVTDQFFWGKTVFENNFGAQPIPQKNIRSETLAKAINELTNNAKIQANVNTLSQQLQQETGIQNAIVFIEKIANTLYYFK